MNFRGINSIFTSQGLKLESFPLALKLLREENQLQRHPTHHKGECRNFDSEEMVFVLCSSYKPPPQTFDNQKFKNGGGAHTPEYTVHTRLFSTIQDKFCL